MLIQEAKWIGKAFYVMRTEKVFPMLNLGSSTKKFREIEQPYIDLYIFRPARELEQTVIHNDLKNGEGVDIVGDILEDHIYFELRRKNIKSILCSNLLEHVTDREIIGKRISALLPSGGVLVVTVPYLYPRHDDPIDNLFRPNVKEIKELFPETELIHSEILNCGLYLIRGYKPINFIIKNLARLSMPFYKPKHWWLAVKRMPWFFRKIAVTCVVLQKK